MSKNVVLTLESRFMDEYGEYANLPVFNAHGSIVGYVGGEVPESGNPCEFNRLNDEGFTFCASATEVVRLKAENAKLREEFDKMDIWHSKELTAAMSENAKLRELVRDMMQAWWACDNEVCPRHDERCEKGKYCAFDECAQELGIEVDE